MPPVGCSAWSPVSAPPSGCGHWWPDLGVTVTDSSLVITGRTILVAVTVGLGVTLLAAVGPARRAARVAPVAALRESTSETAQPASRARKAVGLVAAALAVPAVWFGAAVRAPWPCSLPVPPRSSSPWCSSARPACQRWQGSWAVR